MKVIALGLAAASTFALGLGLADFAMAEPSPPAIVEGVGRPIVLASVVVTASALPDDGPVKAPDCYSNAR